MKTHSPKERDIGNHANAILLFATLVIAICGLIYELLAGTISSYLLGDSVYQFSLIIGLFMASMGIGSFISRYIIGQVAEAFILTQVTTGLIGGYSAVVLFFAFSHLENYHAFLFLIVFLLGSLVGLEIPLVIRLLKTFNILRVNVSNVLTADYIGALFASLLFPLVLLPQLGLIRSSLVFGLLNIFVAGMGLYVFQAHLGNFRKLASITVVAGITLITGLVMAHSIDDFFQARLYSGEVIVNKTTPYQKIIVNRDGDAISLFLNGQLQFSTLDEYRYHESLIHPVMSLANRNRDILILGGGDGLAVREVLKFEGVNSVTLVDLDPAITRLFSQTPLSQINDNALSDPRVHILNQDAWKFLESNQDFYDVIIIDLPDPNDISLSKLYTVEFYSLVAKHLGSSGILVTQATSPLYARQAFWCIAQTLSEARSGVSMSDHLKILPYHAYVPTFGEWGFVLASPRKYKWLDIKLEVPVRFLNASVLKGMTEFPTDMDQIATEINYLQNHILVKYYEQEWQRWYR